MPYIEGDLILPGNPSPGLARAHVSLVDATYTDKAASVLAETDIALEPHMQAPVHFRLELPQEMPANRRWLFDATVTAEPGGALAEGDYILDRAVEWVEKASHDHFRLHLIRVT